MHVVENHIRRTNCPTYPASLYVNLDALNANVDRIRECAGDAILMAVVKANAYGMGLAWVATHLWDTGVHWFGVAHLSEALVLRKTFTEYGVDPTEAHILTWLDASNGGWREALGNNLDVSVSTATQLDQIGETVLSEKNGGIFSGPARIHLKVDTGMARGGASEVDLPNLVHKVVALQKSGLIELVGFWSHLARADDLSSEGKQFTQNQVDSFERSLDILFSANLTPQFRHLAATAGTIWHPQTHYDMVRVGLGLHGLSPDPSVATPQELGLIPVAALRTVLGQIRLVEPGTAVSYGGTWVSPDRRWIGLLPVGYQDGIARELSNRGLVSFNVGSETVKAPIVGRICMDQTVVDLGNGKEPLVSTGSVATVFGDARRGEPTVDDFAAGAGTISHEVLAGLPTHLNRVFKTERVVEL